ncbi:MAG: indole-3-glycerol-phosphate synthase [Candidatus Bathyarchaeota archaeon]|nr:MAG: indole-3-glycerol-phosphate synthase [Candidatus Bathyarchaeota archaeon]
MADFLDVLAKDTQETISSGYYEALKETVTAHISLKRAILEAKNAPVITEIKAASPSAGIIRKNLEASGIAESMEKGGAIGISILTEPKHFNGRLRTLVEARNAVKLPILMKDIIISPVQLDAASKAGANAALLIETLFDRGYCECNIHDMIARAHSAGLEVLLETHTEEEFRSAVRTHADAVGINNRDLATFKVELNVTKRILERNSTEGKIIVSESGINTPADLRLLRECGAHAFLIGSAVMLADNVEKKVKEFVSAL